MKDASESNIRLRLPWLISFSLGQIQMDATN